MLFDLIFLSLFITGWAICGVFPWLVTSVLTRGNAGLVFLPASMAVAVLCGLLVPFLGGTGVTGIWLSFVAAIIGPTVLLVARRISLVALESESPAPPAPATPGEPTE